MRRSKHIETSNNKENPNKNVCGLAVAEKLGVAHEVRYIHTIGDLVRAVRKKYTVRSRMSSVKGKTVGAIRKELKALNAKYFIIRVDGHVLLLNGEGETIRDTDARKKDKRKFTHLYGVFDPTNFDLRINKNLNIRIERIL